MTSLTEKELSSLEDLLAAEEILVRKYQTYASMATDPQIRSKFQQYAAKHRNHYTRLLGQLH